MKTARMIRPADMLAALALLAVAAASIFLFGWFAGVQLGGGR